ncbi:MAG: hypothetical protein AAGI38_04375 [Bacteroidota bacterium]
MNHLYFTLLLMLLLMGNVLAVPADSCPEVDHLQTMPFEAFDHLQLTQCGLPSLVLLMGAAEYMVNDTNETAQIRAEIVFSLIADELQRRNTAEVLDPQDPACLLLVERLAKHTYHLALTRPSDWEKLAHYAQEGRWAYIGQRFFDRGMHYLALALLAFAIVGFLLVHRQRKRNRATL